MTTIQELDRKLTKAQDDMNAIAEERAIAIAMEAERIGRGGQAAIARELGIKEPQVARLVARGRQLMKGRR